MVFIQGRAFFLVRRVCIIGLAQQQRGSSQELKAWRLWRHTAHVHKIVRMPVTFAAGSHAIFITGINGAVFFSPVLSRRDVRGFLIESLRSLWVFKARGSVVKHTHAEKEREGNHQQSFTSFSPSPTLSAGVKLAYKFLIRLSTLMRINPSRRRHWQQPDNLNTFQAGGTEFLIDIQEVGQRQPTRRLRPTPDAACRKKNNWPQLTITQSSSRRIKPKLNFSASREDPLINVSIDD